LANRPVTAVRPADLRASVAGRTRSLPRTAGCLGARRHGANTQVRMLATMERPQTKYVDVGGAEVAYQVVGQGPPDLIWVPGWGHVDLVWEDPVDLVAGSGITFEDRGDHQLKGVPGSWKLYEAMS